MPVGGGWILTADQVAAWKAKDIAEYNEWVEYGLFDESSRFLYDAPSWMTDGKPNNGPFDFNIPQSQQGHGW